MKDKVCECCKVIVTLEINSNILNDTKGTWYKLHGEKE
jgi:hypothetical protein